MKPPQSLLFLYMLPIRFIPVLLLVITLFAGCKDNERRSNALEEYLPEGAQHIVKINSLQALRSDLETNPFYSGSELKGSLSFVKDQKGFLSYLDSGNEGILFSKKIDSLKEFTFLTAYDSDLFNSDSIPSAVLSKIPYKKVEIHRVDIDSTASFSAKIDSVLVISTSEKIVEQIIDGSRITNDYWEKSLKLNTDDEIVSVSSLQGVRFNDSVDASIGDLASLRIKMLPEGISASGVAMVNDSVPQLLSLFQGLIPQKNNLPLVIPISAERAISITFNDTEIFNRNLQLWQKDSLELSPVFDAANEIGWIDMESGSTFVLPSINPEATWDEISTQVELTNPYKEVNVYLLEEESAIFAPFRLLFPASKPSFVYRLGDFFLFSTNEKTTQDMITAYKNGAVLSNASYFENASTELSAASSFTSYQMDGNVDTLLSTLLKTSGGNLTEFPLSAVQFSRDRDFAHVNVVSREMGTASASSGVISELFTLSLDQTTLNEPQFFSNHRSRGKDIIIQDINNQLYLVSSSGKVLWKKQLDGPVLGEIKEVDLLRNGKKQLAFCTPKTFHILDRNGKNVRPFPLKYKDEITQPLAVFDYDKKRNYRFVVTQGKEVFMYDSKAKIVQGFKFKGTSSDIVLPPKHIRMSNKDYIVIAEENGKLNILSRVGKERVKVSKSYDFSETPIFSEGNKFIIITAQNAKESITQGGKTESQALNVSENYYFNIQGGVKATLDDNLLRINGRLVELPFGLYSPPMIYTTNRKTFVTVTELQEKKVYLFDKNGTMVQGFPVYGSSVADMGDANNNGKPDLVVKGGAKEILCYEVR